MSSVADPSNANTDETGYDATSLVFESALIVSHHLGKQLGMDIDGTGNSASCSATGYVMSNRTNNDRYRPEAAGRFSQFSRCSAATLEQQLPTYTCLFRETAGRSICGNGVVETERGEECDCGGGDADGVCAIGDAYDSFVADTYCNATTCLFIPETIAAAAPPPSPSPPPATYEPHAWCDAGCGEARAKGGSVYVTDVPWDKCLRCTANFLEEDCSTDAAPFKGWVDDAGGTRNTACAWTGCVADGAGGRCDGGEIETASEACVVDGADGTNTRCCVQQPLWSCCGLLSCSPVTASPPPPFPPPSPSPAAPPPPFPSPPSPVAWGWGLLGGDDDDLQGDAAFQFSAESVSISFDGTRVAIGAPSADGTGGAPFGGRVRVLEYDAGTTSWVKVGDDLLGDGQLDGFGKKVGLSNDGKMLAVAAPSHGFEDLGVVRVYEEMADSWSQIAKDLTGDESFAWYGSDIAFSTNNTKRLAVAGGKTSAGVFTGVVRAYVYFQGDNEWVQAGEDISDFAYASAASGTDHAALRTNLGVSDDGLTLAIGTPLSTNDDDEVSAGATKVYRYASKTWTQLGLAFAGTTPGPSRVGGGRFRRRRARRSARLAGERTTTVSAASRFISGTIPARLGIRWARPSRASGGTIAWEVPCLCPPTAGLSPLARPEPTARNKMTRGERIPGRRVCSSIPPGFGSSLVPRPSAKQRGIAPAPPCV